MTTHRGTGVPPVINTRDRYTNNHEAKIRYGAYLPHLTKPNGIYFVTFRLADSLPQQVLMEWKQERDDLVKRSEELGEPLNPAEIARLQRLLSEKVERYLDSGMGQCWMKRSEIADSVENALKHFDANRYRLIAWCVMPNHVHVVVKPFLDFKLEQILHSWKSFTAHQANRQLKRSGPFWQPETYDHLIRDAKDLEHSIDYTLANPQQAGLNNWRWLGFSKPALMESLE